MPAQTLMYKCNWARYIYKAICASFETGKTIPNRWFYFCGLGLNLKLLKFSFSFYSTYKQYKLFWYFFSFLKYSKLNIGIFILQNIFSLFPIHLSIKSFLLPKLWLKCPTFFVAGLGPIVFFYRWITWPDVLLGCFLVLTWCCFLLTDWILLFYRFAHLSHDWGLPLVFSASVPLASVSSYCRGDPDQFILEMASYSPMTLLLLFFFFLFG